MHRLKLSKYKLGVVLILLSICRWFYIFQISKFIYPPSFINISVIIISTIIILLNLGRPVLEKNPNNFFKKWIFLTIPLYLLELVYSLILYSKYGQTLLDTIAQSFSIFVLLAYFPLVYLQKKILNVDYLKDVIKIISLISAILSILQVFLFNYGVVFLDIFKYLFRYGNLRFGIAGELISISMIMSLFDFFYCKKKSDLFAVLIEFFSFVYAFKTRTVLIYIIFTIIFLTITFLKNRKIKFFMIVFTSFLLVLFIITNYSLLNLDSYKDDSGIMIRFETINYYMNQFMEKPLFGMGFIAGRLNSELHYLLFGPLGYFYRNDVGIIGLINEKGILGLLWYIILIIICFFYSFKLYKGNKKKYIWAIAICVYITICSINIIYVDAERFATLVVYMAMLYHYYLVNYEK